MNPLISASGTGMTVDSGRVQISPWLACFVLISLAVSTFGLPLVLGLSWWPSWSTPGLQIEEVSRSYRFHPSLDMWTFATVTWPARHLVAQQLRDGILPVWDPNSSFGLPLAGRYEIQVFSPLEWPAIFGGPGLWTLLLVLSVALAGVGTYLFLRRIRLDDVPALGGAISYMFSAFFLWFFTMPAFVNEAMMVPWLFWAVEGLRNGQDRGLRQVGVAGLLIGLTFLAGQPQVAILTVLGCAIYLSLASGLSLTRQRLPRQLLFFGVSLLLGAGVAAVQLALSYEAYKFGYTLHPPESYAKTGIGSLAFTTSVWPFLMGQFQAFWRSGDSLAGFTQEGFAMLIGTTGVIMLSFIVSHMIAPARRRTDSLEPEVWGLFLLLFVIVAFLLPTGAEHLWARSVLNRINFPRYVPPLMSFVVATLIAAGVHLMVRLTPRRLVTASAISFAILVVLIFPVPQVARTSPAAVNVPYMRASIILSAVPSLVVLVVANAIAFRAASGRLSVARAQIALVLLLVAETTGYLRYGLGLNDEALRLLVFLAVSGCAVLAVRGWLRVVPPVLLGAFLLTVLIVYLAPNRLPERSDPFKDALPEYVGFLERVLERSPTRGRILTTYAYLTPNYPSSIGLPQLPTNSPIQVETTAWYVLNALAAEPLRYSRHYVIPNQWWGMTADPDKSSNPATISWDNYVARRKYYNFIGIKYLIDSPNGWWSRRQEPGIKLVYQDSIARVYEDTAALPRAFSVDRVRLVPDLTVARAALLEPETDVRTGAIVEAGRTPLPEVLLDPSNASNSHRPAHILTYSATLVELDADLTRPSLVVLTDAFYPGWQATMNGQPTEIYRVNAAVRGVVAPTGRHRIVFRYQPTYLRVGLIMSAGSTLFCVLAGIFLQTGTLSGRRSLKTTRSRRSIFFVGVLVGLAILAVAVVYARPKPAPFPAEIDVAFLGRVATDVVAETNVESDGKPDIGFRLAVKPLGATITRFVRITVMASDAAGNYAGGGRWDTDGKGIRALGVVRDGKLLNAGPKREISIDIKEPTVLDLHIEDGGMTSFWKYFALKVKADGGFEYTSVMERGSWRSRRR